MNKKQIAHDITIQFISKNSIEDAVASYYQIFDDVISAIEQYAPDDDYSEPIITNCPF